MLAFLCRTVIILSLLLGASQPAPAQIVIAPSAVCCSATDCPHCPKGSALPLTCCVAAASPLFLPGVTALFLRPVEPCCNVTASDVTADARRDAPPSPPPRAA